MRLLLDIDILLDVALQRPGEAATSQVIARCGREYEAWLAWHSVATLAYLIEHQHSATEAREVVRGFSGSPVPAMTPEVFVQKHMLESTAARRRKPPIA